MKNSYKNFLNLKKKKVFVLGGSGLIGKEICKAFLENQSQIINLDLEKGNIKNKKLHFHYFDCTNLDDLNKNLNSIYNLFGCPDIFINSSYPQKLNWSDQNHRKFDLKTLQQNIDAHLNTYIWISYFFAKKMKVNKIKGSIVNLSSIYGYIVQDPNLYKKTNINLNMMYGTIKSGISHFTKQLASIYGKYEIRANSILPGGLYGHIAGTSKKQDKIFLKNYSLSTPMKRLGYPEEVAKLILFLSSDASSYITGESILIDGGKSII